MGSILLSRSEIMDYLQEIVGFKAGIALTKDDPGDTELDVCYVEPTTLFGSVVKL